MFPIAFTTLSVAVVSGAHVRSQPYTPVHMQINAYHCIMCYVTAHIVCTQYISIENKRCIATYVSYCYYVL